MSLDLAARESLDALIREKLGRPLDQLAGTLASIALLNLEETAAVMSLDRETVRRICERHPELVINAGRAKRVRVALLAQLIEQGGDLLAREEEPTPIVRKRRRAATA